MARTHKKVRYSPKSKGKEYTPVTAAQDVEQAFKVLEGRWKLLILFHLFGGKVLRFSELERAIPAISQKMLIQQLRQMEARRHGPADRPPSGAAESRIWTDRLGTGSMPGARRFAEMGRGARHAIRHESNWALRACGNRVDPAPAIRERFCITSPAEIPPQPHTSSAISTTIRSFAHCSSSASTLPSSVEAKPHCGERQS